MVCNRFLAPSSELALTDLEGDLGVLHRSWQGQVAFRAACSGLPAF